MLQAGSAFWPRIRPEDDDGVVSTHFGYRWNGVDDPLTASFLAAGRLPELHVWLALSPTFCPVVDGPVLIDPTTGDWPERASLADLEWTAAQPPEFLWATEAEYDALAGVSYRADPVACEVADDLASREIYPTLATALRTLREER